MKREERTAQQKVWDENKKWTDSLVTEVKVAPITEAHDTDLDYVRKLEVLIAESSLGTAWEHFREEAEEILKTSPNDPEALKTLEEYREYERKQAIPVEKRAGLVLLKKPERKRNIKPSKAGQWVRDKNHGWLVKSAGQVGDVVPVRRRDGTTENVKLLERVFAGVNFFRGGTV